jgi:hypothetical protein
MFLFPVQLTMKCAEPLVGKTNTNMKMLIDTTDLTIPLRYYKGWNIEFTTKTERFNSPILGLFGFSSVADLEKAMDYALATQGRRELL